HFLNHFKIKALDRKCALKLLVADHLKICLCEVIHDNHVSVRNSSVWNLLNFLKFRHKEENWTASKQKEHNCYVMTLGMIAGTGLSEMRPMDEANTKEVNDFWQDVEKERNIKEYETIIENLDMAFTVERTLEHNDYVREVGERRRQVMKRTSENCEDMTSEKNTNQKKRANYTTAKSKKVKATNGHSASPSSAREHDTETDSERSELEFIDVEEELTQDEAEIRNKLLGILVEYQNKDKKSGENYMSSVCLNSILDLSDKDIYKTVKRTLDMDQLDWLEKVIVKKNWKPTSEFVQYIERFTEDACTRTEIPTI
ncbi:2101_t:CDS:2, partial [Funneliformis geosporum]